MPLDGTLYEDEILRILSAAQERIRDPKNWCQGTFGDWANRTQFCAYGALLNEPNPTAALVLIDTVAQEQGYGGSISLNDRTDHPTVMAMFQRAIEMRSQEISENALAAR